MSAVVPYLRQTHGQTDPTGGTLAECIAIINVMNNKKEEWTKTNTAELVCMRSVCGRCIWPGAEHWLATRPGAASLIPALSE